MIGGAVIGTLNILGMPAILGDIMASSKAVQKIETSQQYKNINDVAKQAKNWLGKDAKLITNKVGDKVFISKDGLRKMRFDINNPHGYPPHIQLEKFINGKWQDALPGVHHIYPKP